MIMSIPVLMTLQYILENYASKTPGRKPVPPVTAIPTTKENPEEPLQIGLKSAENTDSLHTTNQSDFARVITMSVTAGGGKKGASKAEIAHFAYAGWWKSCFFV